MVNLVPRVETGLESSSNLVFVAVGKVDVGMFDWRAVLGEFLEAQHYGVLRSGSPDKR